MIKHLPNKPSNNFIRLRNSLISSVGKAIGDYNMIEDGDTILTCMSGGKDSHAMLMILLALQERAPINFKIIAMNLDQKQPGFPVDILPAYFERLAVDYRIVEADTYAVVKDKIPEGKTTCSLCSRLRRGIIYTTAKKLGANKIALGHHRDDIVETLFLNMFFGAKMKAMPPKLATNDKQNIVIRPLAYCSEKDIASYARQMDFPIIPCDLCGSQDNLQRQKIKALLQTWEREQPGRINNIFRAIANVEPSHLADTDLYDFKGLSQADSNDEDPLFGDIANEGAALSIASESGKRIEFTRN
ncbi:MAG: tRNA 2-thiocytidine(32) synthetase TtcA [Methylophilaceae bacterium]